MLALWKSVRADWQEAFGSASETDHLVEGQLRLDKEHTQAARQTSISASKTQVTFCQQCVLVSAIEETFLNELDAHRREEGL